MPESTIVKTIRDGKIEVLDGSSAVIYTADYEVGNFQLTIPGPTVNVFLDRGQFGSTPSVRYGQDQPMTGSFSAHFRDAYDAGYATLLAIATGTYAGATGTLGANAEVKLWKLKWTIEGTNHGDSADHTILCDHCMFNCSLAEGDPTTLTMNFTSYDVYPTLT